MKNGTSLQEGPSPPSAHLARERRVTAKTKALAVAGVRDRCAGALELCLGPAGARTERYPGVDRGCASNDATVVDCDEEVGAASGTDGSRGRLPEPGPSRGITVAVLHPSVGRGRRDSPLQRESGGSEPENGCRDQHPPIHVKSFPNQLGDGDVPRAPVEAHLANCMAALERCPYASHPFKLNPGSPTLSVG